MKAEFSDAYRMRNSVLVMLLAGVVVIGMGFVLAVKEFAGWVKYAWEN